MRAKVTEVTVVIIAFAGAGSAFYKKAKNGKKTASKFHITHMI